MIKPGGFLVVILIYLDILTFMATLLSKDQAKFSELNSDFSNKIFVSFLNLLKMSD